MKKYLISISLFLFLGTSLFGESKNKINILNDSYDFTFDKISKLSNENFSSLSFILLNQSTLEKKLREKLKKLKKKRDMNGGIALGSSLIGTYFGVSFIGGITKDFETEEEEKKHENKMWTYFLVSMGSFTIAYLTFKEVIKLSMEINDINEELLSLRIGGSNFGMTSNHFQNLRLSFVLEIKF